MVEIVKQLGWTYVSTVAAQGEYGEKVGEIITEEISRNTAFQAVNKSEMHKFQSKELWLHFIIVLSNISLALVNFNVFPKFEIWSLIIVKLGSLISHTEL